MIDWRNDREEHYRLLLEVSSNIGEGIGIVDENERLLYCNPAFASIFETTVESLLGRDVRDFFEKELHPVFERETRKRMTGEASSYELPLSGAEGTRKQVRLTVTPRFDENGRYIGAFGAVIDITKWKQTEAALREALQLNERLITSISSILVAVDWNDTVALWNDAAENTFEIPRLSVIGRDFFSCGIEWDQTELRRRAGLCRQSRAPVSLQDFPFERSTGERRFLNITLNPLSGNNGKQIGFLVLAEDITLRKVWERKMIQSQKLESIGQLAAGIAHEINSPMQYIEHNVLFLDDSFRSLLRVVEAFRDFLETAKGNPVLRSATRALRSVCEDEEIRYLAEEIPRALRQSLEGIERVTGIVSAMKTFSHPGRGEKEPVDINRAIETTVAVARNEWKYVADMELELDERLPPVPCLPDEFNQVILNIVTNAAHAIAERVGDTEKKGTISIRTRYGGDRVEIRIDDTGTGIAEEVRARIYDPFFTTKDVGKGTGQGLAIARDVVVNKLSGSIDFETEIGRGTTFVIFLPTESSSGSGSDG